MRDITLADFVQRPQIRAALARQYAGGTWCCDVCGALAPRRGCDGVSAAGARLAGHLSRRKPPPANADEWRAVADKLRYLER